MAVVASIAANPPSLDPSEQYKTRMRLRIKTKSPAGNTTAPTGAFVVQVQVHKIKSYGPQKQRYAMQEWYPRLLTKRWAFDSLRKL